MRCCIIILFVCATAISAQAQPLYETRERFHPVLAKSGMVATQQELATRVGVDVLRDGGNAFDAAVATGFMLAVVLPRAGSLGGGGFMVLWLHDRKQAIAIDYRETAPHAVTRDMFVKPDGSVDEIANTMSHKAVAVPGTVAGLLLVHQHYGTLPLSRLLAPAIAAARNGFAMPHGMADTIYHMRDRLRANAAAKHQFFKPDGSFYQPGELFVQRDLANTLERIAQKGAAGFYRGPVAQRIVADMQQNNGLMTLDDLANYQAKVVQPIAGNYKGYTIYAMPPPSSGGITLLEILNILEPLQLQRLPWNSAQYLHLLTEASNLAYRDRNQELGDPAFVSVPVAHLLDKKYAAKLSATINYRKHTPSYKIAQPPLPSGEGDNTTHVSIIDKHGNMVANTVTLNFSFGSGIVVPKTGIILNNEMSDFTVKLGVPNAFGLVQGAQNAIAPGKRPLSSMAPIIVLDPHRAPLLATGSPGGSRIITTVLQLLLNVIDHHYNIAQATNASRMHSQLWPDELYVEEGISFDTIELLRQMGHHVVTTLAMGSLQTVSRSQWLEGAADPRRIGALAQGY